MDINVTFSYSFKIDGASGLEAQGREVLALCEKHVERLRADLGAELEERGLSSLWVEKRQSQGGT